MASNVELEKKVVWERETAEQEAGALRAEVELIADKLAGIVHALREYPELLTETPGIHARYDPREDLKALDRPSVLEACRKYGQAKERLRQAEKNFKEIRFGTNQTRIEIEDSDPDELA